MYNFAEARTHMMDSQILTAGVVNPAVIEAFSTMPREQFAPEIYAKIAYNDEDLPIGHGRFLIEPLVHAKILEAAKPTKEDIVLDIGCGTGYSSAILSSLAGTVVALEGDQDLLERANHIWDQNEFCNIASFVGDVRAGVPENAPYDLILINGAVCEVPDALINQLAPDGRLIAIIKKAGHVMGDVTLIERNGEQGGYSSYSLFHAGCPYLAEFTPAESFSF